MRYKLMVALVAVIIFFAVFYWYESLKPDPAVKADIEKTLRESGHPEMKFEDIQFDLWKFSVLWTIYIVVMTAIFYLIVGKDEETHP